MSDELASALAAALGGGVDDLQRLSGGASRETWGLTLDGVPLILQRERPGGHPHRRGDGGGGRSRSGPRRPRVCPSPRSWPPARATTTAWARPGSWPAGSRARPSPRRILREDELAGARGRARRRSAVRPSPRSTGSTRTRSPASTRWSRSSQFRDLIDALGQPHPAFELGLRWLEANRPPPSGRAVVHGDFRNGNLIVGPDGLRAVLDWELAHLGDPARGPGLAVRAGLALRRRRPGRRLRHAGGPVRGLRGCRRPTGRSRRWPAGGRCSAPSSGA